MGRTIPFKKDWFRHWFDTSFYHQLYAERNDKEASGFLDELLALMEPATGSQMLDLGCGKGRHSKRLAASNYDVTGLDLAASSIREAKKSEAANLKFRRHDMRLPFGNHQFDYVFNLFTSFGYFQSSNEDDSVVQNISASLKTGGMLVMDYINCLFAEKKLVPFETRELDSIQYNIRRWTNDKYFFKNIIVEKKKSAVRFTFTEQVSKFSLSDFESMFEKHNLRVQQVYGNYNLEDFSPDNSPRLIMMVKKIAS